MAFNGINGILGTGGGKSASRGKQGRNQDLICPDHDKEKAGGEFLQKIYHYSPSSQHQGFPVKNIVPGFSDRARDRFFSTEISDFCSRAGYKQTLQCPPVFPD
jgi:hypothetical protein